MRSRYGITVKGGEKEKEKEGGVGEGGSLQKEARVFDRVSAGGLLRFDGLCFVARKHEAD